MEAGFGLASEAGCKSIFSFSKTDLAAKFLDFANVPDEQVGPINYDELPCPKGKKASKRCKEKNGEKDEDESETPSKTEDRNQPTETNDQASKTSDQASSTTTDAGPTARPDCDAIGRNNLENVLEEIPSEPEEKRTVGTTLQGRRLQARDYGFKAGTSCKRKRKTTLDSRKYPQSGDEFMVGQADTHLPGRSIIWSVND